MSGSVYKVLLLLTCVTSIRADPPHIVFILADDLGYSDIGYHGSDMDTPNLDRLAAEGVKLENYYTQPTCSPSRSQLMTGRYQAKMGLQRGTILPCQANGVPNDNNTVFFSTILEENNYKTHFVGKWHLGFYKKEYTPLHRGFKTFYGNLPGYSDHFRYEYCNRKFMPGLKTLNNATDGAPCGYSLVHQTSEHGFTADKSPVGTFSTHTYTAKAIELIQAAQKYNARDRLFLFVSYQAPHSPIQAPKKYYAKYRNIANRERRTYAGMVATIDEGVKNITDALKASDLWKNTVLIFSSDNGANVAYGGSNWPLRGGKGHYWEGGIRAVAFVTSPVLNDEQKGTVNKQLMHISDWWATFIAMAEINYDRTKTDGHEQWGMIKSGENSRRTNIVYNIDLTIKPIGLRLYNCTGCFDHRYHASMRDGQFKILTGNQGSDKWYPIQSPRGFPPLPQITDMDFTAKNTKNIWLFNIEKDPLELKDITYTNEDVTNNLLKKLEIEKKKIAKPIKQMCDSKCSRQLNNGVWAPRSKDEKGEKAKLVPCWPMMSPPKGQAQRPRDRKVVGGTRNPVNISKLVYTMCFVFVRLFRQLL